MLPTNNDISLLFPLIVNKLIVNEPLVTADMPPLNSQSMVPNLNVSTTEANILIAGISRQAPLPPSLLVPLI